MQSYHWLLYDNDFKWIPMGKVTFNEDYTVRWTRYHHTPSRETHPIFQSGTWELTDGQLSFQL